MGFMNPDSGGGSNPFAAGLAGQGQSGMPSPTQPSTTSAPLPSALPPTPTPTSHLNVDPAAAPVSAMPSPDAMPQQQQATPPSALSAIPPQPNQSVSLPSFGGINPMVSALQGQRHDPYQNQPQTPFGGQGSNGGGGFGRMTGFG